MNTDRTCNECGWVHKGITSEQINEDIVGFVEMFCELTTAEQHRHYNNQMPAIHDFLKCKKCGNSYENFRESKDDDCPRGATIPAILIGQNE